MRTAWSTAAALAAALLAGCSTINSRIQDHQAAFDASSPAVQRKIKAGQVDVGFTQEQAAMALGRPDRIFTTKTAARIREVWVYGAGGGGVRVGIGFASFGPHSAVGVGTAVGDGSGGGARLRVIFDGGVVTSVVTRQ